ncbi:hypothetical protein FHS29_005032 [Saccharothrix tamanrassetensis]|uniref:Uncharacterized protein n=1 Tax=Saccharothrix tamanrassetensis TaxID=1051531 RepID=A0A841CPZ1_9PSEU|nr:hypothetical protein [Saccharothrix tamanrassetensis]MBB5958424.1 hypothetical protein [Saccharothrix tamanrassetensis]
MGDRAALTRAAAVAAVLLADYGDEVNAWAVDLRSRPNCQTGAVVSFQLGHVPAWDWEACLVALARSAVALGFSEVELVPQGDYVRVVAVGEVSTSAGAARVEVWDHLTGDAVRSAADRLQIVLDRDAGPVTVPVAHLLQTFAVMA